MSKSEARWPLFTIRFSPEERALLTALRANLRHDHGSLTLAGVLRVALAQLATFRGVQTPT